MRSGANAVQIARSGRKRGGGSTFITGGPNVSSVRIPCYVSTTIKASSFSSTVAERDAAWWGGDTRTKSMKYRRPNVDYE
jgi:hypothetical protein